MMKKILNKKTNPRAKEKAKLKPSNNRFRNALSNPRSRYISSFCWTRDTFTISPLQEFCRLIFNTSIIDATLSSMNYDANKLPLGKPWSHSHYLRILLTNEQGKLSKATILKGFAALKVCSRSEIYTWITQKLHPRHSLKLLITPTAKKQRGGADNRQDVQNSPTDITRAFQLHRRHPSNLIRLHSISIIPHDFGRNKPPAINTQNALKKVRAKYFLLQLDY